MQLALYCPVYGYYEAEKDRIGRRGDYLTSVSVGALFGQLLAFQFAHWLSTLEPAAPDPLLVEAGAHDAELAADILGWMERQRPRLYEKIQYWIVEPSASKQERQRRTLANFSSKVQWATDLEAIPSMNKSESNRLDAVIFSNELFDAMPVHRLGWDAQRQLWFEWGVTRQQHQFVWESLPAEQTTAALVPQFPEPLLRALPDGFVMEVGVAARDWWRQAARRLGRGRLVGIDYGWTLEEMLVPERNEGTLRAYARHQVSRDVLAHPGEQDITASVNFSSLMAAGESEGLTTEIWLGQDTFLTRIAAETWKPHSDFGDWSLADRRQFQSLTHPDHFGRSFRVLIQKRA